MWCVPVGPSETVRVLLVSLLLLLASLVLQLLLMVYRLLSLLLSSSSSLLSLLLLLLLDLLFVLPVNQGIPDYTFPLNNIAWTDFS